ncbi:sulfite exporter TauE/SafE family protein [Pseudomonas baltica]|uniref:sulfite exporter TauE/SafE family protein n=1 Tax=Pseudomonas baltica TaxID=2762576 RepID=UPI0028A27496|nr:sulfite exporter TauE/SafE family protein [Pseudomonas baltica]
MTDILAFYQQLGLALTLMVLATFFAAGTVKGVIGLGLPSVSMGLLGLAMAPVQAAALLIVPATLTNIWQVAFGGHFRSVGLRLWPMQLGIVLGTVLGTLWFGLGSGTGMARALGAALLIYALAGLAAPALRIARRWEVGVGPLCGLLTGAISAGTGVFVIPAVPYLGALGLHRDELVQALGLSFTVSTLALAGGLLWHQQLGTAELGASVLAVVPALLGMLAGQWLRGRINGLWFRRIFFVGMGALGLHLLVNG